MEQKPMIIDKYTKLIMTVLTLALLLNGLNPWLNPPQAAAVETTATSGNANNCSSDNKVSTQTLEGVNNVERLLGYIETSVNEIQLTISGIDRKLSKSYSNSSWEKGDLIVEKH
ncbi:MAG: hypothetical protein HOJ79_13005 [Nitrospina sp.]|nr:hypothetical protein [Nitrospina sp.]